MNITTNTNTEFPVRWKGGTGQFVVSGTPDGATISLEFLNEGADEWVAVGADSTFADSQGTALFTLPQGTVLRVTTTEGGGSLDINVGLNSVG